MLAGRNLRSLSIALGLSVGSLLPAGVMYAQAPLHVVSPDGRNDVSVGIRDGYLWYSVDHDKRPILLPSRLGFAFRGAPELQKGLRITDTSRST